MALTLFYQYPISGTVTGSLHGTSSVATTAVTASYALTSAGTVQNAVTASYISGNITFPNGLAVTGSVTASAYTGSFVGSGAGLHSVPTASYAVTASYAANGGGASDWNTLANKPVGIVSSSVQINTGSFSGSFKGDGSLLHSLVSASHAVTSAYATVAQNVLGAIATASLAYTASYFSGTIEFPNGLSVTGSVTASAYTGSFVGNGAGLHSIPTASYAITASYVAGATSDWNTLANKPVGIVSSSIQINTGSFSGSFKGDGSQLHSIVSATYAGTDWVAISNKPVGLVTSSIQVSTGSYSGTFVGSGNGLHSIPTASYAITASYVAGTSGADWNTLANKPVGIVSSSVQINTGSFSGSFKGDGSQLHSISFPNIVVPLSGSRNSKMYYHPGQVSSTTLGTLALTANSVRFHPFFVPSNARVVMETAAFITANAAAGGTCSVAIYDVDQTTGFPSTLVATSSVIYLGSNNTLTSGTISATLTSNKMYYIAYNTNTGSTIRAIAVAGAMGMCHSDNFPTNNFMGYSSASTWGAGSAFTPAWPASAGTGFATIQNAAAPLFGLLFQS